MCLVFCRLLFFFFPPCSWFLVSSSWCRTPSLGSTMWNLDPFFLWENLCNCDHLPAFGHYLRVWVLTALLLWLSHLCHCSYFFIYLVAEVFSASLLLILVCSCSANMVILVCPWQEWAQSLPAPSFQATLAKECLVFNGQFQPKRH